MLFLIYCHKCAVTPMGAGIKHEINACATDPSELKAQPTALNAQPQTVFFYSCLSMESKKAFQRKIFHCHWKLCDSSSNSTPLPQTALE